MVLPAWCKMCAAQGLKPKLMPRNVVRRWNSTHNMLSFALRYRKVIDGITAKKALKLRKFELDAEDWQIVEDLVSVLEVSTIHLRFRFQVTKLINLSIAIQEGYAFFSQDGAGIAAVIPAMDRLTSGLHPSTKRIYHISIIAAMKLTRKKLDRYYSLTDLAAPYRIAMSTYARPSSC